MTGGMVTNVSHITILPAAAAGDEEHPAVC
jgi:hypothetical protein